MAVRARRSACGQHFLRSSALAAEIVRAAGVRPGELVLDLGAGTGVLTGALVRAGARAVAVELDPALAAALRLRFDAVVEADVRTLDLPCKPFRVVANLPFGGATEILRKLLDPCIALVSADVIVQWEVAVKRTALWPSTRLGVEWSTWYELSLVRRLPRCCFAPPPLVDAALLRAVRRDTPSVPAQEAPELRRFLDRGFRAGLRAVVPPRTLKRVALELGFSPAAAPRDLDAHQWASLYRLRSRAG